MKIEKVQKHIKNLHDKEEYIIHIRNFLKALNHGLGLKKVNRDTKFNKKAWFKPYINFDIELGKKAKNYLEKIFSSWRIIQFSEKL